MSENTKIMIRKIYHILGDGMMMRYSGFSISMLNTIILTEDNEWAIL